MISKICTVQFYLFLLMQPIHVISITESQFKLSSSCLDTDDTVMMQARTGSVIECGVSCLQYAGHTCQAFSVSTTTPRVCFLHSTTKEGDECPDSLKQYVKLFQQCMNGGTYNTESGSCDCAGGYVGGRCERLMTDCSEGAEYSYYRRAKGVYTIQPSLSFSPFQVYCQMKDGGHTFIQYRSKGDSTNFNRTSEEYQEGFGDLTGSHWLGNQYIRYLTESRDHDLVVMINVEPEQGTEYYVRGNYLNFHLEADTYSMEFDSFESVSNSKLGDCLTALQGVSFSTPDSDNDENAEVNCALLYGSGWWFKDCTECNPNGLMIDPGGNRTGVPYELFWTPGLGNLSPTEMKMMLKPH